MVDSRKWMTRNQVLKALKMGVGTFLKHQETNPIRTFKGKERSRNGRAITYYLAKDVKQAQLNREKYLRGEWLDDQIQRTVKWQESECSIQHDDTTEAEAWSIIVLASAESDGPGGTFGGTIEWSDMEIEKAKEIFSERVKRITKVMRKEKQRTGRDGAELTLLKEASK